MSESSRIAAAPAQAVRGQVRGTAHVGRFCRPTTSSIHVGEPGRAGPRHLSLPAAPGPRRRHPRGTETAAARVTCPRRVPRTRRDPTTRLMGQSTPEDWSQMRSLARCMGPGRPGTLCLTGGPEQKLQLYGYHYQLYYYSPLLSKFQEQNKQTKGVSKC
jgi:hypothetical protein